jgi:hypothetical protein
VLVLVIERSHAGGVYEHLVDELDVVAGLDPLPTVGCARAAVAGLERAAHRSALAHEHPQRLSLGSFWPVALACATSSGPAHECHVGSS